jgi:hypothetical protein
MRNQVILIGKNNSLLKTSTYSHTKKTVALEMKNQVNFYLPEITVYLK